MRTYIEFMLNGKRHKVGELSPTTTLLTYLRRNQKLTGSKEGCAEGDCGACTVVVGELKDVMVQYRAVNSCILFLPMLDGLSLTTVEHLHAQRHTQGPANEMHPVQHALYINHGSQCGFCTPGFVMSLYAAYMNGALHTNPPPARAEIDRIFAGNLCRCTGYGPIIAAARALSDTPLLPWVSEMQNRESAALKEIAHQDPVHLSFAKQDYYIPKKLTQLAEIYQKHKTAHIVAGATDIGLWVTKQHRTLKTLIDINQVEELQHIKQNASLLRLGAGVTYSAALDLIASHYPDFGAMIQRIGSAQIRNSGTIGGNIANASPIGDTPPALIALGAILHLRCGENSRDLPLEDYFIDYGKQNRQSGEFVEAITIPLNVPADQIKCYKISKRFDQDISALLGCFNIGLENNTITSARIAYGGMAATPKRAQLAEQALIGHAPTDDILEQACTALAQDFTPISDMRASARYRLLAAQNLLRKYFYERLSSRQMPAYSRVYEAEYKRIAEHAAPAE